MINRKSQLTAPVADDLWNIKEPTHCLKRVGDVVHGVRHFHEVPCRVRISLPIQGNPMWQVDYNQKNSEKIQELKTTVTRLP